MVEYENVFSKKAGFRAVAYARFSSDNQREESIDAQLRAIHNYAQRNDIIIVDEYIDRAKSATTNNRPAFLDMIKESIKGDFDIIIVHKLDRFARNRYDSAYYNHQLKRNGVRLVSVIEHIDDSPEGIMMQAVLEGMAEFYSQNLAREVRKGLYENAIKGMHTGGMPPLGYDIDPITRKLVINEREAAAVRLVFQRYLEGVGYKLIVDELNSFGVKSKRDRPFCKNSIHTILSNEKYMGIYIFNRASEKDVDGRRNNHRSKDVFEIVRLNDAVPAIVSEADFEAVRKKMQTNKRAFLGHKVNETYLLTGKLVCGQCGGMYCGSSRKEGQNKKKIIRYACNMRQRYSKSYCSNKDIRREYIEALVLEELSNHIFDDGLIPFVFQYYNDFQEQLNGDQLIVLKDVIKQKKEIEKDINTLIDLLTKTSSKSMLERLSALEEEKVNLEKQIMDIGHIKTNALSEQEIRMLFYGARKMFLDKSLKSIRTLIEMFVERIVLHPDRVEIQYTFQNNSPLQRNNFPNKDESKHKEDIKPENDKPDGISLLSHQASQKLSYWCGGGGENRTLVRKSPSATFSERSR